MYRRIPTTFKASKLSIKVCIMPIRRINEYILKAGSTRGFHSSKQDPLGPNRPIRRSIAFSAASSAASSIASSIPSSIGFSGAGFLGVYHLGVLQYLHDKHLLKLPISPSAYKSAPSQSASSQSAPPSTNGENKPEQILLGKDALATIPSHGLRNFGCSRGRGTLNLSRTLHGTPSLKDTSV